MSKNQSFTPEAEAALMVQVYKDIGKKLLPLIEVDDSVSDSLYNHLKNDVPLDLIVKDLDFHNTIKEMSEKYGLDPDRIILAFACIGMALSPLTEAISKID